jgi:hypothetical protein
MRMSFMLWRNLAALALTLLGLSQMAGYCVGNKSLRGLGAASVVAPFPRVFNDVDGHEPFAADFRLLGRDAQGAPFEIELGPERYAGLRGPYNRRNVYGAALAFAPRLPEPLWQAVWCYGLGPAGTLRKELALPVGAQGLRLQIATRTRGRTDLWEYSPSCTE